jgi:hypothetical protein
MSEESKPCVKTPYMSEQYANIEIKRIKAKSSRDTVPKRAYKCDDCGYWHLTSKNDYKKPEKKPKELMVIEKQAARIEAQQAIIKELKTVISMRNSTIRTLKSKLEKVETK